MMLLLFSPNFVKAVLLKNTHFCLKTQHRTDWLLVFRTSSLHSNQVRLQNRFKMFPQFLPKHLNLIEEKVEIKKKNPENNAFTCSNFYQIKLH